MKVVVAGGGNVGAFIASQLLVAGHEVTVIDIDAGRVATAQSATPGVTWIVGDACEPGQLASTGIGEADVVAAVTGDDEDNLVVSLLAKQEFGVTRVVSRVNNPANEWMFDEAWGVDVSVSTPHLLTALVEEAVSVGSLVRLLSFEHGRASLVEFTLAEDAAVVGSEISQIGFPRDSTVVAILRRDRVVVPRGDTMLAALDEVLVLVTVDSEAAVRDILSKT